MDQKLTEMLAGPGAEWAAWVTHLGEPQVALPLLVVILGFRLGWRDAGRHLRRLCFAGLVLLVVVQGVKRTLDRPRPAAVLTGVSGLPGGHLTHHAFPSGHSAFAAFVGGALMASPATGLWRAVVGLAVVAVGWSRIAIGAHWVSDVVVGLVLGFGLAFAAVGRHRRITRSGSGESG